MTMQDRTLQAIINMIDELDALRADGVPPDAWHKHMHELRSAAWNAYHAQIEIVKKQQSAA